MDHETVQTHIAGVGIGTSGLFMGWVLGGSLPGGEPLSQTTAAIMGRWVDGIQTAASAFQGMGMSPDAASVSACALGLLAPVAVGIAISNTGRMAVKLGQTGVREFWDKWRKLGDGATVKPWCQAIEDAFGKVDAVFAGKDTLSGGGSYFVRTEDGNFHAVNEQVYRSFRKEILKDKAAVLVAGEKIMSYADGKLGSVMSLVRDNSRGAVEFEYIVKDAVTKAETRTTLDGYIKGKLGAARDPAPAGLHI